MKAQIPTVNDLAAELKKKCDVWLGPGSGNALVTEVRVPESNPPFFVHLDEDVFMEHIHGTTAAVSIRVNILARFLYFSNSCGLVDFCNKVLCMTLRWCGY